jgi:hypothetical protein
MPNQPTQIYLALVLVLALITVACEQAERHSSEHLVFNVDAAVESEDNPAGFISFLDGSILKINSPGGNFKPPDSTGPSASSSYTPTWLSIDFTQQGDLVPSLLLPLGYKVTTRIEFDDGSVISVSHTNVADSLYIVAGDSLADTLYLSIRGEGLISGGKNLFEDVTGLFFEQSTYRIVNDTLITNISCNYQLLIDY